MASFTLSTIYKAVDKFSGPLRVMQSANAKFAAAQSKALGALKNTFNNVGRQLISLAGGLSIAVLIGTGFNAIKDYDEALGSLSAITGVTGKKFELFKTQVVDVAGRTRKSAVEVAKAFELVGSARPELLADAKGLSMVSEAAIILSKASKDDLATSARNLTGVMNQFNLAATESQRAINVLAAGSLVGAANISQINEAMVNVGAVANSANFSLEQTVAAIEVLGSKQIFGAEAGTKLRGVILRLQKAGLGYKSGQFQINDALAEANSKMLNLTTAKQKDAMVNKLFGAENVTAGKIILANTKMFEEMTKGVTGTNVATQQAATNSATFAVRLQELKARFENLIIKGNESSGALNAFGKIIVFVTDNLDKIILIIGILSGAYAAYYTIMTTVNIVTKAVTAAQWLWNAALTANPIGIIIVAIGALIAGIVLLIKNWDKVKAKMDEWSNSAVFQILSLVNPLMKIIEFIGFVQDRWQGIKKAFSEGGILGGIVAIGKTLLSFVLKPLEVILKAVGKIPGMKWASNASEQIGEFRANLDKDLVQPVNPQAAQTQRYEEINKQQLSIMLQNKTDKKVNVNYNPALIPVTTQTYK
jgi:TP901 family phage tail tape measure protein